MAVDLNGNSSFLHAWTGGCLKTHDFLQPLEQVGKATAKQETSVEISTVEKPPPSAPPPSVEHILPGGIGTYSISHISYFNPRVPKPEGTIFTVAQASSADDENSNCSSYTGSGFTLWEESALKKGKTGKENLGERSNILRGKSSFNCCGHGFIGVCFHCCVCTCMQGISSHGTWGQNYW